MLHEYQIFIDENPAQELVEDRRRKESFYDTNGVVLILFVNCFLLATSAAALTFPLSHIII